MRRTALLVLLCAPLFAAGYEKPPTLDASEVLSADLVKGEHFSVDQKVVNDGLMNSYVIDSDFGEFKALGTVQLKNRVHEVGALAELDDLSKSEVFVQAVGEGAIRSLRGFGAIVKDPVGTAKGLPDGVGRFFKRTKHHAQAGYDQAKDLVTDDDEAEGEEGQDSEGETEESEKSNTEKASAYAQKYFGVNQAQRRWAQKLEVDPYTSNPVLQGALKDVAEVDSAGRFAARLAPIPRVPGAGYANTITSLVWNREPWELVEENKKGLVAAGASEETIELFFANVHYSPTIQTVLVQALLDLNGAEGAEGALELAATAETEDEALFFAQGATMLRWFHHQQAPIVRILEGGSVFVGITDGERVVAVPPVDYLVWTKRLAEGLEGPSAELGRQGSLEMWVAGTTSTRARQGLESLGWTVETEVGQAMRDNPVKPPAESG